MPTWYHVSPNRFDKFSPKYSPKFDTHGVFICPTLYGIVHDWAGVVASRKRGKTKMRAAGVDKVGNVSLEFPAHARENYYQTLYLYHIWVRPDIARELKAYYDEKWEEARKRSEVDENFRFYSAWCWGPEVFFPKEYLKPEYVRIVKTEKVRTHDLYHRVPWRVYMNRGKEE